MDTSKIVELLRAILGNPFRESYLFNRKEEAVPDVQGAAIASVNPVSPTFKLAFWWVLILTVWSGLLAGVIAFAADDPLTSNQQAIFDLANTSWNMGFGAIIGLIGGKAT